MGTEIWELKPEHNDYIFFFCIEIKLQFNAIILAKCFSYASLVPKDITMQSINLTSLWMALGIFQSPGDKMELDNLVNYAPKNFVQDLSFNMSTTMGKFIL